MWCLQDEQVVMRVRSRVLTLAFDPGLRKA